MMGRYAIDSLKDVSADRTEDAVKVIRELGGEVRAMYALLGDIDILFIVELPGTEEAVKASLLLSTLTGIGFSTSPALEVPDFDRLASP